MKKTVVIVDDFPNTRKVIEFALKKIEDVEFLGASDAEEALSFFDGRKIDILLTDFNMPGMNGAELTIQVRSRAKYAYIPILMLTTETSEEKKELGKQSGITGWIKKPFKAEELLELVQKCLR